MFKIFLRSIVCYENFTKNSFKVFFSMDTKYFVIKLLCCILPVAVMDSSKNTIDKSVKIIVVL